MKVAIQGIGLLAPGLVGWEIGRAVLAGHGSFQPDEMPDPEAALLPPNERRRSSDCVRWALHVAQEAIAQSGLNPREVPTVFASSGGEMGVIDAVCRTLATPDRVISPTLFHQSVHNTAAGYWSIATTCQQSSTALSCYDDSFAAGLLEAITFVCVEQRPVLLVAYDLAVPAPLNEARPITIGFAVALVLAPPSGSSFVSMHLRLEEAHQDEASRLQDPALEQVRQDNPAARSLPLLRAIATGGSQRIILSLLDSQQLVLDLAMPQLTKEELGTFLPHAGAMRLIDRVEWWDDRTIQCRTRSHHDLTNPLRHGTRLEAVTGLEYAAQAMGVHVGLLDRTRSTEGLIGYVGGLRDVVFDVDRLDECPAELTINATRVFEGDNSFMYQFSISSGGQAVMTGRASLFLKDGQS